MTVTADDKELLRQFHVPESRDRAFTTLLTKYRKKLYWHIRRMVISHEDADDVLQNTFVRIWNGLPGFREDAGLYTWMYRIATNECLSFLEQRKKKASVSFDEVADWLQDRLIAEPGFDASKLEWKLQLAMQRLPEKQRLVFTLRYYDALPYEDMSRILDTSVGALKASYHHAVKKVEEFLLSH